MLLLLLLLQQDWLLGWLLLEGGRCCWGCVCLQGRACTPNRARVASAPICCSISLSASCKPPHRPVPRTAQPVLLPASFLPLARLLLTRLTLAPTIHPATT